MQFGPGRLVSNFKFQCLCFFVELTRAVLLCMVLIELEFAANKPFSCSHAFTEKQLLLCLRCFYSF